MRSADERFIRPRTLSLITTYRCTAACESCCFGCSPKSEGQLSFEQIEEAIISVHRLGSLKTVVFTGGECFLLKNDLVRAVKLAAQLGLRTRCVTNGYWAKSLEQGRKRLNELVDAGLSELNISTGDYHQRYVPLDVVENATVLAMEMSLTTRIVVEETAHRTCTAEDVAGLPAVNALLAKHPLPGQPKALEILESPWMPMDHNETIVQRKERMLNREKLSKCTGCSSIFTTIVRSPDSDGLGVCCGLSRRQIAELNKPFGTKDLEGTLAKAGEDFLKIWLHVEGPERILAWAASKNPSIRWEDRYSHQCHACLALFHDPNVRDTIIAHHEERVEDVLLRYSLSLHAQDLLDSETFG